MAISWQHTKGANCGTGSSATTYYTAFEYSKNCASANSAALPHVWVSASNIIGEPGTGATDLGYLIVSDATDQKIEKDFSFAERLFFYDGTATAESGYFEGVETAFVASVSSSNHYEWYIGSVKQLDLTASQFSIAHFASFGGSTYTVGSVFFASDVTASIGINALYFNSTSDVRAKDNITLFSKPVLDLVKHLNLYTFNYKGQDEKCLGLIAQEVAGVNLDGFELVADKDADGVKEFMKLKESKIVYLLLKAVQEQQEEIEQLKSRLK